MQTISSGSNSSGSSLPGKADQFQASDFSFYQRKPAKSASQSPIVLVSPPAHQQAASSRPLVKLPAAPELPFRQSLTPLPSQARQPVPQAQHAPITDQHRPLRMRPGPAACPAWKRVVRDSPVTASATKQAPPLISRLANLVRTPVHQPTAPQAASTHVAGVHPAHCSERLASVRSCDNVTAISKESHAAAVGGSEANRSQHQPLPHQAAHPAAQPNAHKQLGEQQSSLPETAAPAAAAAATDDAAALTSLPGTEATADSFQSPASDNCDHHTPGQPHGPAQHSIPPIQAPQTISASLPAVPTSASKGSTGSRSRLRLQRPPAASTSAPRPGLAHPCDGLPSAAATAPQVTIIACWASSTVWPQCYPTASAITPLHSYRLTFLASRRIWNRN